MRVLVVSNMYPSKEKPYSGIFVRNQVEWLRHDLAGRAEIEVLAMARRLTGRWGSLSKYLGFLRQLIPALFRSYDVVHIHYLVPLVAFGWFYKLLHPKACFVLTMHGSDVMGGAFQGRLKPLWQALSRAIDVGICVGPALYQVAHTDVPAKTLEVFSAGVDTEVFKLAEQKVRDIDFLYIGSLFTVKGADILRHAIKSEAGGREARWVVVGSGSLQRDFVQLAEAGHIEYYPHLEQQAVADLMQRARWLVAPSRREAFGLVAVEAQYCGTPVIAADIEAFRDTVSEGETGLLFESERPDAFIQCIRAASDMGGDAWSRLSQAAAASQRVHAREAIVNRLSRIYMTCGSETDEAV